MEASENSKKWPIFIILLGGAFVLLFIFVLWKWGGSGLWIVLKYFLIFSVILAIFALIVAAFFWLFKKHKKEMVYIMRNAIIRSCKINKAQYKQELWLEGGKPFSARKVGDIIGFAMIKSGLKKIHSASTGKLIELDKAKDVIFVTFANGGKIAQFFGGVHVFVGIHPDDFANDLIAPMVRIKDDGFGLTPRLFRMLWCSKHWHKRHIIEETMKDTIYRYIIEDNLNNIKTIIDKGVMVDPVVDETSIAAQTGLDKKIGLKPI